MKNQKK